MFEVNAVSRIEHDVRDGDKISYISSQKYKGDSLYGLICSCVSAFFQSEAGILNDFDVLLPGI